MKYKFILTILNLFSTESFMYLRLIFNEQKDKEFFQKKKITIMSLKHVNEISFQCIFLFPNSSKKTLFQSKVT